MSIAVRSLPIKYAGKSLRSRAELKWAMFFDLLGVEWVYEQQAYEIGNAVYWPDFWLPGLRCFVEIKGHSEQDNIWKVKKFQTQMESICPVHIFIMGPDRAALSDLSCVFPGNVSKAVEFIRKNYARVVKNLLSGATLEQEYLPCGHPDNSRYKSAWESQGFFWFRGFCLNCNILWQIVQEEAMCS